MNFKKKKRRCPVDGYIKWFTKLIFSINSITFQLHDSCLLNEIKLQKQLICPENFDKNMLIFMRFLGDLINYTHIYNLYTDIEVYENLTTDVIADFTNDVLFIEVIEES